LIRRGDLGLEGGDVLVYHSANFLLGGPKLPRKEDGAASALVRSKRPSWREHVCSLAVKIMPGAA
jgi:hypothetical protein